MRRHLLLLPLALLALSPAVHAADPVDDEKKLRETLRNTILQLRTAQDQNATLQASLDAAKADADETKKDLGGKVAALGKQLDATTKQAATDKAASDKIIADLNAKVTDQTSQIAQFVDVLTQWKAAYNQAAQIARDKEAERVKLVSQTIDMQRQLDDDKARNVDLYKTAMEVLGRFEKFSLGDALEAKEPFVGATRVKLENLVQKYQDKITAQKIATSTQ